MVSDKLYEIGGNLGLNKKDIDGVLSTRPANKDNVESISPVEVYKAIGRYGTVSINDFQEARRHHVYVSK